jgi:hypothetical protein
MPNLPISQLPQASTLNGNELFAIVQGGITKYVPHYYIVTSLTSNYGLFNQTGSSTPVTNTTSELTLLDGGVGTLTIPSNSFRKGDAFHAILTGKLSAANNNTLEIRIKSDSTILADTGLITMSGTTDKDWEMEVYFSINEIGTAGVASISTGGSFNYTKDAGSALEGKIFSVNNFTTFNTTINNTLEITAQWGSASPSNIIYSQICTLNKTF